MSLDPITVMTIDRGVLPMEPIATDHPLPAPSAMLDNLDPRRVRALVVDVADHHAGPGDGESPDDGNADTMDAPGDQHRPARDVHAPRSSQPTPSSQDGRLPSFHLRLQPMLGRCGSGTGRPSRTRSRAPRSSS